MADRRELAIARLGAQGDGIAETPAGPVYVPDALPGEVVVAEVEASRARRTELLRPSPDRTTPACRHFGQCGGCATQHMSAQLYSSWKRDLVRTAFSHRGLDVPLEDIMVVPPGRRRRATLTAERQGANALLGFHEEGSHTLVPIEACPVMLPSIEAALPKLREIAEAILVRGADKLRLAITATGEGLDVAISGSATAIAPAARARIAELAREAGILRVMASGDILMQSAVPRLTFAAASVALPPEAFTQATAEAEIAIAEILADATTKARRIADLFCGLGTFTFGLARRARVLAVDGDKTAIAALSAAAKAAPGIKPLETKVRDLIREPLSRTELSGLDAVVFDPPRAGAQHQADALARSQVPVVCAISCNPATLARDCRIMVDGGYSIERVVPIDQFLWSPHVEAVAVLRRAKRG